MTATIRWAGADTLIGGLRADTFVLGTGDVVLADSDGVGDIYDVTGATQTGQWVSHSFWVLDHFELVYSFVELSAQYDVPHLSGAAEDLALETLFTGADVGVTPIFEYQSGYDGHLLDYLNIAPGIGATVTPFYLFNTTTDTLFYMLPVGPGGTALALATFDDGVIPTLDFLL